MPGRTADPIGAAGAVGESLPIENFLQIGPDFTLP
jgi:hypothetical protein